MRTEKDVEAYLLRQGRRFEPAEGAGKPTYLLSAEDGATTVAVRVEAPLVVVRVHIGDVKTDAQAGTPGKPAMEGGGDTALFRRLLELNARALVHTCYGLEDNHIVLTAALELENLDYNELAAVLDEVDLAVVQQVPELFDVSSKKGKA